MLPRHCIVTPQFPGLVRNGGIGTHCFYLAQFLQKQGAHTTLLYTAQGIDGPRPSEGSLPFDLNFVWERELPHIPSLDETYFLQTSARCYEWLKTQRFDFIHFQDWRADGFRCVQAKRTGQAFAQTILSCMLNGSSLWCRQGMKQDPFRTREDMLLDYCEAYTARYCDELLSPSQYSLDWARDNWQINHPRASVLPYLFTAPFRAENLDEKIENLIFFGRLEMRKGLEVFLQALLALEHQGALRRKVIFVGRSALEPGGNSVLYIEEFFKTNLPEWSFQIEDDLDHAEALQFLRDTPDKLVVIPSLSETLCFTVLECLECNFNFIASNVGGIPELIAESDRLFEPLVPALTAKMADAFAGKLSPVQALWSFRIAEEKWDKFFQDKLKKRDESVAVAEERFPLVSVCIPHFNGAKPYLEETLIALQNQTYCHFEVFVRDDASTSPASLADFNRMASLFGKLGWSFTRNDKNHGPGFTRNRMADLARGEFLFFVDADNVPDPRMIERMVMGALHANLDATGCFMKTILEGKPLYSCQAIHSSWMPVGPALPTVFFDNLVGETNTLFRASVFKAIGGFPEDANYGNEDWETLIRLILRDYSFDIVPEFLFLYRIREGSQVRSTPCIQNRLRAWRPLFEDLPPQKRFLATSLFIWEWRIEANNHAVVAAPPTQEMPRQIHRYESSLLFQIDKLFRHPRKTLKGWFKAKA